MKLFLFFFILAAVESDSDFIKFLQYENITVPDTRTILSFFEASNITDICRKQLEIVSKNTTLLMTMLDASSKFPYSGILYSSRSDYGNFDECLTIDYPYEGGRILGEHCAVGLIIPDIITNSPDFNDWFKLSVCRPSGCSANDYNVILQEVVNITGLFLDVSCTTVETRTEFLAGDIVILTIFAVVIALMIASTVYDVYIQRFKLNSVHPLFLAFSVISNGKKLLHISKHSKSKEQIEVFHGLRVISTMWIVAGHAWIMWPYTAVYNLEYVSNWGMQMSSFYMESAPLSVDTFFFMSGFLLAFQYFKSQAKSSMTNQVFSVPRMIIHRYLRITPALVMVYLVTITIFVHFGTGPVWFTTVDSFKTTCENNWWKFFLYIQNYYDFNDICLIQTWYLSADMQLFLIAPLILIPVSLILQKYGFNSTMWSLLILNIIWTFLPMILKLTIRSYTNGFDTHSRLIDYFIGVMLAIFMRVQIDKPFLYFIKEQFRSVANILTWVLIIPGMFIVTVCFQDEQIHHSFESQKVFEALMRPAWCIGLSWITYSCYHGYGGIVNWILCRPIFQVVARLTYCIYLTHMTVLFYELGEVRNKRYFSEYIGFYQFCGAYIVTCIVAIFWTLAFESPLIIIEKYILGRSGNTNTKIPQVQNGNDNPTLSVIENIRT